MTRRRSGAAALVVVLALAAAACGGGAQPDLGGDASVPATPGDGGGAEAAPASTTSEPPDQEVEVATSLPEGWPDDLPVPDDAVLELAQRTEDDDGTVLLTADFTVADGGANVYTAFLDDLEDAGATVLQRSSGDTSNGFVGSISFSTDEHDGNVAVDEATGTTVLSVSVVLDAS